MRRAQEREWNGGLAAGSGSEGYAGDAVQSWWVSALVVRGC